MKLFSGGEDIQMDFLHQFSSILEGAQPLLVGAQLCSGSFSGGWDVHLTRLLLDPPLTAARDLIGWDFVLLPIRSCVYNLQATSEWNTESRNLVK